MDKPKSLYLMKNSSGRNRFVTDDGAVIVGRRARPNAGDFRRRGRG